MTSSWFFLSTLNYDARSTTHQLFENYRYFKCVFTPQKPLNKTRIKLCNTLPLPVLLYGSETWTVKASDAGRITAAEMKYMRRIAGYDWTDYETNSQIAKELKNNTNFGQITSIQEKLDTTCKLNALK